MEFKIFCFDGCDLYWTDGEERSNRLEFNTLEDAIWAQLVWQNFAAGECGEPVLFTHPDGGVEVILDK